MTSHPKSSSDRSFNLLSPGLFRLFLACVVFAQHSTRLLLGATAVFLFYALSGYWISDMWEAKYRKTVNAPVTFYVSRLWRLFPAFWFANLAAIVEVAWLDKLPGGYSIHNGFGAALQNFFPNIFLLGYAFLPHSHRLLDSAWSLDVELQFYIIFPLLAMLATGWRSFVLLSLGLIGLWAVCIHGEPTYRHLGYYVFFFGIGVLMQHLKRFPSKTLAYVSAVSAALLVLACIRIPAAHGLVLSAAHSDSNSSKWFYAANCFLAVVLFPLAFYTVTVRSDRTDRMLGDLSYLVYLFHIPALFLLLSMSSNYLDLPLRQRAPRLAAVWLAVFLVSYLFWRFVHTPLEVARRRFVAGRTQTESLTDAPPYAGVRQPLA